MAKNMKEKNLNKKGSINKSKEKDNTINLKKIKNSLEKTQAIKIVKKVVKSRVAQNVHLYTEENNPEVRPINEKDLALTKQQKFNFDNNEYEDDKEIIKKKKSSVSVKMYLDLKRKFVKSEKEKNRYKKSFMFMIVISILLLSTSLYFLYIHITYEPKYIEKEKLVQDENIVFLGDSLTEFYNLSKYYGDDKVNFVNSGINGNSTEDILNDMKNRIYRYNPSKVFLLIGTNDIYYGYEDKKILENIDKIVNGINRIRPYAKIYIESIYPTNDTNHERINHKMVENRTNDRINNLNKKIKQYCKKEKISYINMNDILVDEEGNLKLEYTKDGLHLTDKGYEIVTNKLMNYIK